MFRWHGAGHMGWMALWWVLGAVLIGAIVWMVLSPRRGAGAAREGPDEMLRRRYAEGEIDRETYQRMLADLKR